MSDDIDAEIDRLRQLLLATVKGKDLSLRALERQLGIKGGATRKILKGDITLSMRHVLMILKALGVPYAYFFRAAYPLPGDPGMAALPTEASMEDALGRLLVQALWKQLLGEADGREE
jgi:transcriptional regulator with XRE-family HTH domain